MILGGPKGSQGSHKVRLDGALWAMHSQRSDSGMSGHAQMCQVCEAFELTLDLLEF